MVSKDTLLAHIDYAAWASRRLVSAVAELSDDQLQHDFGTSDKSILGTLVHLYRADRIWLSRMHQAADKLVLGDSDFQLSVVREQWPEVYDGWRHFLAGLSDEQILESISYHDLKGNAWSTPVYQIVLHLVNHGTHHRGQVSGFLRTLGQKPPVLDLIAYYRSL
ncbi:DinB family protein [Paludibaculum fermentans]|uniref:DinB family protein n=1 Tax=Paludibaculum fermentans TaxID=1473598 RepID=A0A7S7NU18_PALFE|nr:DinB family protein [Paludibaculum fermentans]QOY89808.1 DinB family protein [Paludibaculum fermentans]